MRITEAEWEVRTVAWDQPRVAASTIVQVLAREEIQELRRVLREKERKT